MCVPRHSTLCRTARALRGAILSVAGKAHTHTTETRERMENEEWRMKNGKHTHTTETRERMENEE